jgi:hypothetical protein
VGYSATSTGAGVMLAERWNGTAWTIQHSPSPRGAKASALYGVSCTSASVCTAAGYYFTSGGTELMLAERWNGTAWTIQPTPSPRGAKASTLYGVSCTSASVCTAAGSYNTSGGTVMTLAERWNGAAWAIQPTPNPGSATGSALYGVSCTSAWACTAAGYHNTRTGQVTLAERWNGTAWAIQPTPNPRGATSSSLTAVSCTSATACTATGYHDTSNGPATRAERWNGTAWAIQPTPSPPGATGSELQEVSCTSASACTAAGYYDTGTGPDTGTAPATLAERWNGTAWAIQPTPSPPGATDSVLYGVSCTTASACTATGASFTSGGIGVTLTERWHGTAWAIQPTPSPRGASDSTLVGVSCTSASACTATGFYDTSTGHATLAERWNGTAWAIQPTPSPRGASDSALVGVSCTSASACTATGYYNTSTGTELTLAERWNGAAWAIQPTSNPGGANGSALEGVSCTSASACTATGSYNTSTGTELTLAERWNGTAWAIQHTPNPRGTHVIGILVGVSCTSASACTATGSYYASTGQGTLAERWNGTAWTIQPTPNPHGNLGSYVYAVSCTSASACTAAGTYVTSTGTGTTLAERWNGTAWAIQPTPNPRGATGSDLQGVSCTSASACTATGYYSTYYNIPAYVTLAERYP